MQDHNEIELKARYWGPGPLPSGARIIGTWTGPGPITERHGVLLAYDDGAVAVGYAGSTTFPTS